MSARTGFAALILSALLAACGGSAAHRTTEPAAVGTEPAATTPPPASGPRPQALVTAETENRLLVVDLPSGRVVGRVPLPPDPEDIAAADLDNPPGRVAIVTSAAAGKVTLLEGAALRPVKIFGAFGTPHIVEMAGYYAYVTDDARGTLTAIDLLKRRVTSTVRVGAGAHHLSFDGVHQTVWVALGESARTIVMLSLADLAHPRVIGRFDPGFSVHDLSFSGYGDQIWITSASGPDVRVFSGTDPRPLFRVPVGPPPQHVAPDGRDAYLTSGYGGTIEKVDAATGRILARATAPYGSFELAAAGGYVVTSSLLRGTLAIYDSRLRLLRVVRLAPAAREVALSFPGESRP